MTDIGVVVQKDVDYEEKSKFKTIHTQINGMVFFWDFFFFIHSTCLHIYMYF